MNLTITAYSTALFSTWINIEELGLLFDAGDGVTSGLLQKSRKIKHIFISHPDRDHITGLFQLNQLNARDGFPKIYYPEHCGSFPAMQNFQYQFDPHVRGTQWHKLVHKDLITFRKDMFVEALRNEHIKAEAHISKSLSFKVFQTKQKLKKEFLSLEGVKVKSLIDAQGKDAIMETVHTNVLSYSGDTPVDDYSKWDQSQILIHEATFLQDEGNIAVASKGNKHSKLDEVLKMVSEITIGTLILTHFSSRYSKKEINYNVRKLCKVYHIKVPVHVIYPGKIHRDILNAKPIYEP